MAYGAPPRQVRRAAPGGTSRPFMSTVPEPEESVAVRMETVVVLPAPFGPSSAKNSPPSTDKEDAVHSLLLGALVALHEFTTRIVGFSANIPKPTAPFAAFRAGAE